MWIRTEPARILFLLAGCASACAAGATLREAADKRGIYIGAATNAGLLDQTSEPQYKSTEQAQFSLTTAENSCKVGPIHPDPDKYDWAGCDTVFDAATASGQKVRGHNLCWHSQNPSWLNSSLSHDQLVAALEGHINDVVKRYGSRAYAWDVVNEAYDDNGIKKDFAPWMPAVPDFIDRAFTAARAAGGADMKLFYNDYGAETVGQKSTTILNALKDMKDRGIPIDGMGFQTHIKNSFGDGQNTSRLVFTDRRRTKTLAPLDLASFEENLKRFAALGLEVHITELDVRACDENSQCDSAALAKQAQVYADLLNICLGIPQCKVFEMWGFTDKHTWITDFENPTHKDEMPLPFGMQYQKKPAFDSMLAVLQGAPAPTPPPAPPARAYEQLTTTCQNAVAITDKLPVASVAECEGKCDAEGGCNSLDTDGKDCYLKSHCEGTVGSCSGWCGYRLK